MTDPTIVISNIYVMLAYAFGAIRSDGKDRIRGQEFHHLHDLLAEILVLGVGAQVKRGLHCDYLNRRDELATIRGRVNITRTVAARSTTRGRLVCEFDEYETDTPHNRALKSVIVLLIRHGSVGAPRKSALRRLLPYLDAVTLVAPMSIRWDTLTYHRSNASYRLLLGVCELIVRGLLPTEDPGDKNLAAWVAEEQMNRLYERFVREYYVLHHPELSPGAAAVAWDYPDTHAHGVEQLPAMRTDVTLRSGPRILILDTKYYSKTMQVGRWGKATVHSDNLYQILAYTKNTDLQRDGSVAGMLLYARTDAQKQPDLDVVIQGNRIGARTLDLGRPWPHLQDQLEEIVEWLAVEPPALAQNR